MLLLSIICQYYYHIQQAVVKAPLNNLVYICIYIHLLQFHIYTTMNVACTIVLFTTLQCTACPPPPPMIVQHLQSSTPVSTIWLSLKMHYLFLV